MSDGLSEIICAKCDIETSKDYLTYEDESNTLVILCKECSNKPVKEVENTLESKGLNFRI